MAALPKLVYILTDPMSFWLIKGQPTLMSRAGFDVHMISSPGAFAEEQCRTERVPFHAVPMARRIAPWADLVSLVRLYCTLGRLRPQVVLAGTPKAGLLGMMAAWMLFLPVRIYYVHGLPVLTARGIRRILLRLTERIACAAATRVVCVGHSMRRELVGGGLCAARKATVIANGSANGVDVRWFNRIRLAEGTREEIRSRLDIPQGALVVGFVGRVVREKGICELHRAWRDLRERCSSAYLLIVGPREATDPIPENTWLELAGDPRVRLIGLDWNTAPLYLAMDLLCLPSHREGCPTVPLEAASMELPVVAFRVPGVVDTVQDGVTGRLIEPLSVDALTDALHGYLLDAEGRKRHGQAGRRRVVALFSRALVWTALTSFYSSLATTSAAGAADTTRARRSPLYRSGLKRWLDALGGALALLAASPVLLAVALMVRSRLGSPILFVQTRPGLHGRPFDIVKFRTMSNECGAEGRPLPEAARLTRFGAFLRSTSLDELPELWNVVKGEMSLVGPRPLLTAYLDRYTPAQAHRHDLPPGMTGLAQVSGRNALTWNRKFALDLEYVERCSLRLDLKILFLTIWQVFVRRGVSHPGHVTMHEFVG